MSKRCSVGLVLAILIGTTSTALASLTSDRDPISAGNVSVNGAPHVEQAQAVSDGSDLLDHFHLSTGCTGFTVDATLPATLPATITVATPLTFDVTFDPTARGLVSCTVSFHTVAHVSIGTDFAIDGTGIAPVIDAPASQAFPSRRVANAVPATASQAITIRNTGDDTLTITAIATTGDFAVPSPPSLPVNIAPSATLNVTVVFDPTAAGLRNGTLDLTSNDPATAVKTVDLSGTGTTAVIAVTDVAFGIVNLTQTSTQSISVTNSATQDIGPLRIASATIVGGSGWFTFDANGFGCLGATDCTFGAGILAPQNISVRCTPPAGSSGLMMATVSFTSDSDAGGDNVAGLSCTAGRADAVVDPTSLDFGAAVDVGSSVQRTVSVTNSGNIDLDYTVTKVGARAGEYTFSGCFTSCIVPPTQTRQFTTTFTPTVAGGANITINVGSNDPDNATIPIAVTATSVAPSISAPGAIAFGSVEVDTSGARTLTITNNGTADLLITTADFTINDGSYAIANGSTGAQTVTPGNTTSWDLTCTPSTTGNHAGRFTINSNAINGAVRNVALTCTGTEGILIVIPTSIDFGGVAENTGPVTRTYRLRNTGNLPVTNIAAVIDPSTVGYAADPATPFPAQILPGVANEVTLNVQFTPLSAADGGPATMTFSGTWGTTNKPLRVPPVLSLNGDGLTTGFDAAPGLLAFGDVRFDQTRTLTFCIENTSQSNVVIQSISITPDAGTVSGEFSVPAANVRRKTCGAAGAGTIEALPSNPLAPGAQLEVTVIADPANRVGAMSATLVVTSNIVVNPTRSVLLTGNSTTAGLMLAPGSTLDFGPRDIQAAATTLDIVITNTGDGPLDLRSFSRDDGGANTHFTFTLPPNTVLAPNTALTIPVTYAPTVVNSPDEVVVLSNQIIGILGGPASQSIMIRGRGIDRTLQLVADPTFPPTFRNPGPDAPTRLVTVRNTGEATLSISAVMLSGDPAVWTLRNPELVDLPGSASFDYIVQFAPTAIGPSSATLVITNNDDGNPMAEVDFTGTGADRNIRFDSDVVNIGFTGIGVPVTIEQAITVRNMNTVDFRVSRVEITDPGTDCSQQAVGAIANAALFEIPETPTDVDVSGGGELPLAMSFAPDEEGKFVAAARLFVEPDPVSQATICVVGNAVFVDARGGGGCSTGRDLGGGAILLLAVLMLRRRRAAAAIVFVLAFASAARAENVVLSIFDPTPATTGTNFQLQSPEVGKDGDWVLTAIISHATNPLVLDAFMDGQFLNDHRVVERSTLFELGGAYAFRARFEAGVRMPIYAQSGQPFGNPQEGFTTRPADGTAAGDLSFHAKVRLWRGGQGTVASALQVTLPTATEGEFTGTEKPSARLLALGALVPNTLQRRITLSANLGAVLRAKSRFANLEQGGGATWGLGVSVRAFDRVWVAGEMFGDILPSARMETSAGNTVSLSPIEWLLGVRWLPDHRFTIGLAAGRGLTSAAGSPEVRGVLSFAFAPGAPAIRPLREPGPPTLDGDADGDRIRDSVDRCPSVAEDDDLFEDTDGCPELDNDGDTIADTADRCPLDPEDKDGFQDTDGCVDKDNDNDGVVDANDKCPNEPEDKDGFQDLDGCPDNDNDGDGIIDSRDRCPAEQETINGNKDDDGCADPGDSAIVLSPDRIETLDTIAFGTGTAKLTKASFNVLGQVAATLRAHPEIIRVRVTCHVHPTGDDEASLQRDQDLSDKRALAVRDWLVQWGITQSRVDARGFGSAKPLAPKDQRGAALLNDRIELIILERK